MRQPRGCFAFFLFAFSVAGGAVSASPKDTVAVIEKVSPSLVRVEYTLRFDRGEPPEAFGRWGRPSPSSPGATRTAPGG